jgi:hypothetical protein
MYVTHRPGTFVMCQSWPYCEGGVCGVRVFSTCSYALLPRDYFCLNLIALVFVGFLFSYAFDATHAQPLKYSRGCENMFFRIYVRFF